jgi:hypothetical protein
LKTKTIWQPWFYVSLCAECCGQKVYFHRKVNFMSYDTFRSILFASEGVVRDEIHVFV